MLRIGDELNCLIPAGSAKTTGVITLSGIANDGVRGRLLLVRDHRGRRPIGHSRLIDHSRGQADEEVLGKRAILANVLTDEIRFARWQPVLRGAGKSGDECNVSQVRNVLDVPTVVPTIVEDAMEADEERHRRDPQGMQECVESFEHGALGARKVVAAAICVTSRTGTPFDLCEDGTSWAKTRRQRR